MKKTSVPNEQRRANIFLDSSRLINYILFMMAMNLLTVTIARKAAWQHIAVAEGGFY
jgi:hypothetical protein